MKITLPAMKATLGKRDYFSCVLALSEIPRLFTFDVVPDMTPEMRDQRVLNKSRINPIANYMLENEDGYLFSSIVASYQGDAEFIPSDVSENLGILEIDLTTAKFIINDGQHRAAGISAALKKNPDLGMEQISVLFFPYESLDRVQQMFSDLNRYVVKTPTALNILFDRRDQRAQVVLEALREVPVFNGLTDKERISLPAKSSSLFTLVSLYEATAEFLIPQLAGRETPMLFQDQVDMTVEFWKEVSENIKDWQDVKSGKKTAIDVRRDGISCHSVMLRAIGSIGAALKMNHPKHWKEGLARGLKKIDWAKSNPEWLNVVIVGNSVVSSRQARIGAKEILRRKFGLPDTAVQQHADVVAETTIPEKTLSKKRRLNVGTRQHAKAA